MQLLGLPVRLHDSFPRMGVRTEKQMADFVGQNVSQDRGQRNGAILFVQALNGINKYVGVNSGTVLNEGDSKDLA